MSDKCPINVRYVRIKKNKNKVSAMRKTASNERFGVMAAVARRKCSGNLQLPAPQEVQWKPPPSQSRHHVSGKRRTARTDSENEKMNVERKA